MELKGLRRRKEKEKREREREREFYFNNFYLCSIFKNNAHNACRRYLMKFEVTDLDERMLLEKESNWRDENANFKYKGLK